jgi:hypothetical protein
VVGITAHVQHSQRHMCSVRSPATRCYRAPVQPEQKIIARWIERTKSRLGWSYQHWADQAGLGAATTITRALKEDYESVTSVKTLHALAAASGQRSILELLEAQADERDGQSAPPPSAESLATLLAALLPLLPRGRTTAQSLRVVAAALQHGLELLGDQSASQEPHLIAVAARGAVARFRDLTQQ